MPYDAFTPGTTTETAWPRKRGLSEHVGRRTLQGGDPELGRSSRHQEALRGTLQTRSLHSTESEPSDGSSETTPPPGSPEVVNRSPAPELVTLSLGTDLPPSMQHDTGIHPGDDSTHASKRLCTSGPSRESTVPKTAVSQPFRGSRRSRISASRVADVRSHARRRLSRPPVKEDIDSDNMSNQTDHGPSTRVDSGLAPADSSTKGSWPHTKNKRLSTAAVLQLPPGNDFASGPPPEPPRLPGSETAKPKWPGLLREAVMSSLSPEELAREVRGIYESLIVVEDKCIKVHNGGASNPKNHLVREDIQRLVALHRTLLFEHHDFLMASQHPSASPALRGLAAKHNMPARMWKYGIHSFLELLRHRRPETQESMMVFIYMAYQMIALLYESVSAFTDTWIECLGDLARYRMAIEEDREVHSNWGVVAAGWYSLAADRHPEIGRLNHHLGILERPSLRKLFLYCKSVTCPIRFANALDSMATLFGPILQDQSTPSGVQSQSAEARIVTYHAQLFKRAEASVLDSTAADAIEKLKVCSSTKIREIGVYLVLAHLSAFFQWGEATNLLWRLFNDNDRNTTLSSQKTPQTGVAAKTTTTTHASATSKSNSAEPSANVFAASSVISFTYFSFNAIIRIGSEGKTFSDTLPSVHVMLVWFHSLYTLRSSVKDDPQQWYDPLVGGSQFEWDSLCAYLNVLVEHKHMTRKLHTCARRRKFFVFESSKKAIKPADDDLPTPKDSKSPTPQPLAEDYHIRGLAWSRDYFPTTWFEDHVDEEERWIESKDTHSRRVERVQWLGLCLAFHTILIAFDAEANRFYVPEQQPQPRPKEKISPPIPPPESGLPELLSPTKSASISGNPLVPGSPDDPFTLVTNPKRQKQKAKSAKSLTMPGPTKGHSSKPIASGRGRSHHTAKPSKTQVGIVGQDPEMEIDDLGEG